MKKIILILIALVIGIVAVRIILSPDQISCEGNTNQMKISYTLSEGRENVRVCWRRLDSNAKWKKGNSEQIGDNNQEKATRILNNHFASGTYKITLSEGSCALPNHFGNTASCKVIGFTSSNRNNSSDAVENPNEVNTADINQSFNESGSFDPFD